MINNPRSARPQTEQIMSVRYSNATLSGAHTPSPTLPADNGDRFRLGIDNSHVAIVVNNLELALVLTAST